MNRLGLLFVSVILFLGSCGGGRELPPPAQAGVLDLSTWNFQKNPIVSLDGEWKFYWKQTYRGIQIEKDLGRTPKSLYQTVPSHWKGLDFFGETIGSFGYATYTLNLILPTNCPSLALHNLDFASAYRMYINGKLVHEEGNFGIDPSYFSPSYKSLHLELEPLEGPVEIAFEISNYHYSKGGFWETSEIGEKHAIANKVSKSYQVTSFLAGSIFLWALYHLGLYWMRRQDKASLCIALFSLFLVLRLLTTGERYLIQLFPEISMDTLLRLEFSTFYIATGVFAYFFRLIFPNTFGKKTMWIINFSIIPFILSLFFPVAIFSSFALPFQAILILVCLWTTVAIIRAFPKDKVGASLSFIGFLFVFLTVVNDILYTNNLVNTTSLTPFGFLGFILFQGYILSYGFTRAYESTERLKETLEESNQELNILKVGLEDLVVERTKELVESRQNIEKLNEFAKALNSSLHLEHILNKAFIYLDQEIHADILILLRVDEEKKELVYHTSIFSSSLPNSENIKENLQNMLVPLDEDAGLFYQVYKRNRTFRFSKVWENRLSQSNQKFVHLIGKFPGLIVPLSSQGKTISLLTLFSTKIEKGFSKDQVRLVESTAESIATAITNSLLVDEMNKEKELAEHAKLAMEVAKNEVVKLNEFTKKINSQSNLDQIIDEMFEYILATFGIDSTILQLVDTQRNEFYTYRTSNPEFVSEDILKYARTLRIPLQESGGLIYKTYLRKKAIYVPKKPKQFSALKDSEIFENLKLEAFAAVPLVVQNEVIGMAYFTTFQKPLQLDREELKRISGFCDQIAGAIQNSLLLQKTEEERKKAEKARGEIQKINEFAKIINSQDNLEKILAEIFAFIRNNYQIEHCVLYYLNKDFSEFRYLNHSGFNQLSDENIGFFKNLRLPLTQDGGFLYQCYLRKKHLYIKRVPQKIPFQVDRDITEKSGMNQFLLSPLINNDEVIAMAVYCMEEGSSPLTRGDVDSIVGISEHIASAINNHFLLHKIEAERLRSEALTLNILPKNVAEELQKRGRVNPVEYENVTLLMTSFPDFSSITSKLTPEELIEGLDLYFSRYDEIIKASGLEKLRMTGDMYLAAGGLPVGNFTHTVDACLAALQIKQETKRLLEDFKDLAFKPKGITIAIHSGPVVAGVIGKTKFNYDVWGKTVTQTQAIRRGGVGYPINISMETYSKVKHLFLADKERKVQTYEGENFSVCELLGIKEELMSDSQSMTPNEVFQKMYTQQKRGAKILIK